MSLLEWSSGEAGPLRERPADCDEGEVATTIISYEEQTRGWMAYIAKARSLARQMEAYRRLRSHLDNYRQIPVLDFHEKRCLAFTRSFAVRAFASELWT